MNINITRTLIMGLVALFSYAIQSTLFNYIEIYGVKPNLILITIISFALVRGKGEGVAYGFFSGLLMDIMAGKVIGLYAIMGMYTGILVGRLNKNLYNENYIIPILITAIGTFFYNILLLAYHSFINMQEQVLWYIFGYILPETIYNTALSIIVYFFILYINKKLDYQKKILRSF